MATIYRVTKPNLKLRMLKYAPAGISTKEINEIVERLSLHSLIFVAHAFHMFYVSHCIYDKYSSVRKLVNKFIEKEVSEFHSFDHVDKDGYVQHFSNDYYGNKKVYN